MSSIQCPVVSKRERERERAQRTQLPAKRFSLFSAAAPRVVACCLAWLAGWLAGWLSVCLAGQPGSQPGCRVVRLLGPFLAPNVVRTFMKHLCQASLGRQNSRDPLPLISCHILLHCPNKKHNKLSTVDRMD